MKMRRVIITVEVDSSEALAVIKQAVLDNESIPYIDYTGEELTVLKKVTVKAA